MNIFIINMYFIFFFKLLLILDFLIIFMLILLVILQNLFGNLSFIKHKNVIDLSKNILISNLLLNIFISIFFCI